jgi:hypothetical protein
MTKYKVYTNSGLKTVFADSVEIEEGGVLAFYEQPGDGDTLKSVAGDDVLVEAYVEWNHFEEA